MKRGSIYTDSRGYVRVYFDGEYYRFSRDREAAERLLATIEGKAVEGNYDKRDYAPGQPLAFDKLAEDWLNVRRGQVRSFRSLALHIGKARDFFGSENIRTIRYARLQDFYCSLPEDMAEKTKKNVFTTLHSFFTDICTREQDQQVPITMPTFPAITLPPAPLRKMVAKEDQAAILRRVKEKTFEQNPKNYYGILWLLTYGMRPGELVVVRMKDFRDGRMYLTNWKGHTVWDIPLVPEDWELVKKDPAIGEVRFFRHNKTKQTKQDEPFGKDLWYRHWKNAARELGFADIDLYGATRHSSASDLSEEFSPEQVRAFWTQHTTTKIFYRYCRAGDKLKREMYWRARRFIANEHNSH